jgi:hypothetical protein
VVSIDLGPQPKALDGPFAALYLSVLVAGTLDQCDFAVEVGLLFSVKS